MSKGKKVVLVGHCVPDSFMLTGAIERAIPGAQVVRANSDAELRQEAAGAALLMVNRVLDGDFADTTGVNVIRSFARTTRTMLISNFSEALEESESLGAVPGFGKKAVGAEETLKRIRAAVAD